MLFSENLSKILFSFNVYLKKVAALMYDLAWTNTQQNAAYIVFEGGWQPNEFADAQQDIQNLLNEVGHHVHLVLHLIEPQPISMELVSQIHSLFLLEHPNRAKMVVIAPPHFVSGMKELVRRLFKGAAPAYLHFVSTIEDAEQLLS